MKNILSITCWLCENVDFTKEPATCARGKDLSVLYHNNMTIPGKGAEMAAQCEHYYPWAGMMVSEDGK